MSHESMARREVCCDFPSDCPKNFDTTDGAPVAALRNKEIVAFCAEHSAFLIDKGVRLRPLEQVQAEYNALHGIPTQPSTAELAGRHERVFIDSLK